MVHTAGIGEEVFLQYITADRRIAGFLRLSLPSVPPIMEELAGAAMIREVHVYGQSLALGEDAPGKAQHSGLGTQLIERAAEIADGARLPAAGRDFVGRHAGVLSQARFCGWGTLPVSGIVIGTNFTRRLCTMKMATKGPEKNDPEDRRATQEHDASSSMSRLEPVDIPSLNSEAPSAAAGTGSERTAAFSARVRGDAGCALYETMALLTVLLGWRIVALIGANMSQGFFDEPWANIKDFLGLESKPAQVTDVTVIVEGIREQALLTALEGRETIWITTEKQRSSILSDAKLRMRYVGQVNLGYDLSQISAADIIVETDRLIMTLPPLQYTLCALHDPVVEKFDCGTSVLGSGNCGTTLNEMQMMAYEEGIAQLLAVARRAAVG